MWQQVLVALGQDYPFPCFLILLAHITFLLSLPVAAPEEGTLRARRAERLQAPGAQEPSQSLEQWSRNLETAHCTLLRPEPARPKVPLFLEQWHQFLSVD